MLRKLVSRRRPTPAMVVALIALVAALGGTSYAALTITGSNVKNSSLTGTDVKNSSLTGTDVKNSSLTGVDVKNRSLTSADLSNGTIRFLKTPSTGTSGATGPSGTTGTTGTTGGVTGFSAFKAASTPIHISADEFSGLDEIQRLTLPTGDFIVNASVQLGSNSANSPLIVCALRDANQVIAQGSASLRALAVFSGNVALTGVSDGGLVTLVCQTDIGATARNASMTAVKVDKLNP